MIMPNTQSKPIANKVAERIQAHVKSFPPPIAFQKSAKAVATKESSDYCDFQMYLDSTNDKSGKSIQSVPIFEDGDPEKMKKLIRRFKSSHLSYEEKLWKVLEHIKLNKKLLMTNKRNHSMMKMFWNTS
jgi:hypothetical protein